MTGIFLLDWATLAVSLHNTILLLWLGLTVLFNAEKRNWGIGLTSGALLVASAFFFSHTAILGHELDFNSVGLDFWWHIGWIPVIVLPFSWYIVMLWYSGFFDQPAFDLRRRHRGWFAIAVLLTLALVMLFALTNPIPPIADIANLQITSGLTVGGIPILLPLYILDILLCLLFSLDALTHPEPSPRMMGDLARQRAQPWLIAAAIDLMIVGSLVAILIVWITSTAEQGLVVDRAMILAVGIFDLVIATLIAASILFIGQAVASYEVFTGKTLPRRGLLRYWRNAIILAMGYGVVIGWALAAQLRPVYSILLTTALLTIFFALLGWRTYVERDHYIQQLRPFVTSQRLYDQLLTTTPSQADVTASFKALCRDVLGARTAMLSAVGSFAPLVAPLKYPVDATVASLTANEIAQFDSPQTMCVQLDASRWAIPLWSERGLIGVLTLGEKIDGGIYAQEEIEIARASGERLIDISASAELARRLMALQRQRLTETQLLDHQARRVLHDDVLPQLHAAMLLSKDTDPQVIDSLSNTHRQISNLLRDLPAMNNSDVARQGVLTALQNVVKYESAEKFDTVTWNIDKDAELAMREMPLLASETLFYAAREAIRNAARHGRADQSMRALNLKMTAQVNAEHGIKIIIEDDGVGIELHQSGDGSGQGLGLHSAMLAIIGGTLSAEPMTHGGTRVTLIVPQSM